MPIAAEAHLPPRIVFGLFLACSVLHLGGCASDGDAIDRRINEIVRGRSDTLGPSSLSPSRLPPRSADVARNASTETSPKSVNPDVAELTYNPADEARDVAARLERYSDASSVAANDSDALRIDLSESFRIGQRSAREFMTAEEQYILSAIRLLIEEHNWSPRLFNDTSTRISGNGDAGRFDHAARIINTLRATQRIPSGGSVEAAWIWDATEQLREQTTQRYTQASRLTLGGNIPLLRGAGEAARESLIQAKRTLVYDARDFERFRRRFLVGIARDYFALVQTLSSIQNQERSLKSSESFASGQLARVEAGRIPAFAANIAENQVLTARASLASLREQYILQLDRFKVRLGLGIDSKLTLAPIAFEVAEPDISLEEATKRALEYRLDLQNQRDKLEDSRRSVANARNELLPSLNADASVGIPTPPDESQGGVAFSVDDLNYSAGLTLSLPLDREQERLRLRSAIIGAQSQARAVDEARDNIVVSVRSAVRGIDLARFRLRLAEQQVEINKRRLEEQNLKIDTVNPKDIVDSENELLSAENARDQAKTDLRNSVLNYLLESDQLRVNRDGTFQPLPGMVPVQANAQPNPTP